MADYREFLEGQVEKLVEACERDDLRPEDKERNEILIEHHLKHIDALKQK